MIQYFFFIKHMIQSWQFLEDMLIDFERLLLPDGEATL